MPRYKKDHDKPRPAKRAIPEPIQAPDSKPEKKLNIPLLESRLSTLLMARNPGEIIATKLKKASPDIRALILQTTSALDECGRVSEQYRYLRAAFSRKLLPKELYGAFTGAVMNLADQLKEDRTHELTTRRYMRRAERLSHASSDAIDTLQKELKGEPDAKYRKVRNYLTDALIEKLIISSKSPTEAKKLMANSPEHLTAPELIRVAGVLFGDEQKRFLTAFQSAYEVAQGHHAPVPSELAVKPSFPAMVRFLHATLSGILTEERRKHALGDESRYSANKLTKLEEQLLDIEAMTEKFNRDAEDDKDDARQAFAREKQERLTYKNMPAMRDIHRFSGKAFTYTPEELEAQASDFIAEEYVALRANYEHLATMPSIVTPEALDILRRIQVGKALIRTLQEELTVPTSRTNAPTVGYSDEVAERRYLNLQNQLRIKKEHGDIEDLGEQLRAAPNSDRARIQRYIATHQERLQGYILLEEIGNAAEELALYREQLEDIDPARRRPIQNAIETLSTQLKGLRVKYNLEQAKKEAREQARQQAQWEKNQKRK